MATTIADPRARRKPARVPAGIDEICAPRKPKNEPMADVPRQLPATPQCGRNQEPERVALDLDGDIE
jgi:hypothetical protein